MKKPLMNLPAKKRFAGLVALFGMLVLAPSGIFAQVAPQTPPDTTTAPPPPPPADQSLLTPPPQPQQQQSAPGFEQSLIPEAQAGPEQSLMSQGSGPGSLGQFASGTGYLGGGSEETGTPLRWGTIALFPSLSYAYTTSNGIQANPGEPTSTTVQDTIANFLLDLGTVWSVDYSPTWQVYSNTAFHDTINQSISVSGHLTANDWSYTVFQSYAKTSNPLIETGGQTTEDNYQTLFRAAYSIDAQYSLDLSASQILVTSIQVPDTYTWSTDDLVDLHLSQDLTLGAGTSAGYTLNDPGNNIIYVQPEVRGSWRATQRLSLSAGTGLEHQYIPAVKSSLNTQTFQGTVGWQPTMTTTVTLGVDRSVTPAQTVNEVSAPTQYTLSLGQRLLQHFFLNAGLTHESETYTLTDPNLPTARTDNINSITTSLATRLFGKLNVSAQYEHTRDASSLAGFGFSSNQYGFRLSYQY